MWKRRPRRRVEVFRIHFWFFFSYFLIDISDNCILLPLSSYTDWPANACIDYAKQQNIHRKFSFYIYICPYTIIIIIISIYGIHMYIYIWSHTIIYIDICNMSVYVYECVYMWMFVCVYVCWNFFHFIRLRWKKLGWIFEFCE